MTTIAGRRAALATSLATISGLRVFDSWPDTNEMNVPCAWVHGPLTRTLDTFDGQASRTWEVVLIVASSQDQRRRSQAAVDPYLDESGAQSIIAAVETDEELSVSGWIDYGVNEVSAESAFWGVRFQITELGA